VFDAVSLGIISIKGLLILFTANLIDLMIEFPISLSWPDNGIRRPILIFSSAIVF
jgi:hypothetical protein